MTITGDGSRAIRWCLNFGPNTGNINLGGDVALAGPGLSDDKVIWNFTSSQRAYPAQQQRLQLPRRWLSMGFLLGTQRRLSTLV